MDLPNLFTVDMAKAAQRVCVVILTDHSAIAGLLLIHPSGTQLRSISEQIEYKDEKHVPTAVDEVLQQLGKESEDINEVIFCLEAEWFGTDGELLPAKQALLKDLKTELSLTPVGYVLQHETVRDYLIVQQKGLTSISLFFTRSSIFASLVAEGAVVGSINCPRSGEIQTDVVTALVQLAAETGQTQLPGKILCSTIALELSELFELQQELLTVAWPESLSFAQLPAVEVIKPQLSAQIVVSGAGKALEQVEASESVTLPAAPIAATAAVEEELAVEAFEETALGPGSEPSIEHAAVGNVDSTETVETAVFADPATEMSSAVEIIPEPAAAPLPVTAATTKPRIGWKKWFGSSHGKQPDKKHLVLAGAGAAIIGLLVVLLVGYLFLLFTAKVQLTVIPKTKQLSQEVELTLDPTITAPDIEQRKVRAEKLVAQVEGSDSTSASGVKLVGEKAKGEVILFNKTNTAKTFGSGTVLSSGKLQYTLDNTVEVPAATTSAKASGTGEEKEYGQQKAAVTATVIGIDNNIDKDKELTVENFDSGTYAAKTNTALSGGSSREVRVVSKTDLDVLLADLKKQLLAKAKSDLEAKQGEGQRVIPLDAVKIVKQTYSAKEGDEVDSVSLDLSVEATGLAYAKDDLVPIAQELLKGLVPSGYSLDGHQPQILSAGSASGSGQVKVTVNLSSKAHALVEPSSLQQQLASMPLEQAKSTLTGNQAIEKSEFAILPPLAASIIRQVPADASRFVVLINVPE